MIGSLKAMTAITHAGVAEEHSGGLPQLDPTSWASQVFWLIVAFGVLYVLLSRVFLPRLSAMIEERRDRIADDLDAAASLRGESEDAGKALEAALADARARARAIVTRQREQAEAEIEAETARAAAVLDDKLAEAGAAIDQRKQVALASVADAASDAAAAVVAKLIGVTPDQAETAQAVAAAAGEDRG